jgi:glycosyltransferase involved in cell wall biosynthesis
MPTSLAAALWCRTSGTPYVLFSETTALRRRPWALRAAKRAMLPAIVAGARAWLATGTLSRDYLVAHGARAERVHRFANTPDVDALRAAVEEARPRRSATRAALGTPDDAVVVLHVGRLIGAKDVATLLDAWALLEARTGAAAPWLWVVGDGQEAKTLRARSERLSLARVRFAGARRPSELPDAWAAADVFALASRHEPWGVVVNEAMAAGLPVVLSDRVGAAADLLADGENGRLVAAGDAPGFAAALGELAADAGLRARMGAASSRRISDWTYASSVEGFLAAVRDAAGARA